MDLEDYQELKKVIEENQLNLEQREFNIKFILFDCPVIISSFFSNTMKSDLIAKKFSLITISALPYSVKNDSRECWFKACKNIKKQLTQDEYKELQNITTKLIPPLDLPQNFEIKWP